ncbi:hypothetical protein HOY80DRAFT_1061537 [Tuber brumale]|nr:hypothetical protein HOY80DRAFT_1061537 [Tuber brumale]
MHHMLPATHHRYTITGYHLVVDHGSWNSRHQNANGGVLAIVEMGTPMGFGTVAYTRSTVLEDCIKDVGKAFQSPPTKNAGGFASPPLEKETGAIIAPYPEYSYVAFRCGIDHRADAKKINPTIDDFGITRFKGGPDTPIQSPRKTISKFVAIKDPHHDGVTAIVKDKTSTFLKAKKK